MGQKIKKPSPQFKEKVARVFTTRSDVAILETLASWLRSYESTKNRLEGYSYYLKKEIRRLMKNLGLKEHRFKRTFIRLDDVWTIPADDKGYQIFEKIIEAVGEEKAKEWVKVKPESIHIVKVTYEITTKARAEIEKDGLTEPILRIIGNTPRLTVGPIPKRVKKGQPRKRKKTK